MSSPHLGQRVVVVTSYLILSVDHLVRELQLLSVNIRTFVFAIEIPGYNVERWHTMTNRFHFFFAWHSVLRSSNEAERLSRWPIHLPVVIGLQK